MKQVNEKNIANVIENYKQSVRNSFPSVFTKDDVLSLLAQLHLSLDDMGTEFEIKTDTDQITSEDVANTLRDMYKHINDELENYDDISSDVIDLSSATFSLNGNEIELDNVDFDAYEISNHYKKSIKGIAEAFIDEYVEQNPLPSLTQLTPTK